MSKAKLVSIFSIVIFLVFTIAVYFVVKNNFYYFTEKKIQEFLVSKGFKNPKIKITKIKKNEIAVKEILLDDFSEIHGLHIKTKKNIYEAIRNDIEIDNVKVEKLTLNIVEQNNIYNFEEIIKQFKSEDSKNDSKTNIKINNIELPKAQVFVKNKLGYFENRIDSKLNFLNNKITFEIENKVFGELNSQDIKIKKIDSKLFIKGLYNLNTKECIIDDVRSKNELNEIESVYEKYNVNVGKIEFDFKNENRLISKIENIKNNIKIKYNYKITNLRDTKFHEYYKAVNIKGEGDFYRNKIKSNLEADFENKLILKVNVLSDLDKKNAKINVSSNEFNIANVDNLILKTIKQDKLKFGGILTFNSEISINSFSNLQTSKIISNVDISNVDIIKENMSANGVNLKIKVINDLLAPENAIAFGSLKVDKIKTEVEANNLYFDYTYNPEIVTVRNISLDILKGKIKTDSLAYNLKNKITSSSNIKLTKIDLESLMNIGLKDEVKATGTLSGTFPLKFDNSNFYIDNGKLYSNGPGFIRYQSKAAANVTSTNFYTKMLYDYLEDFNYKDIEFITNSNKDYDVNSKMIVLGNNKKMYGGKPLKLTLNLKFNIEKLLKSKQGYTEIPKDIEENFVKSYNRK